MTQSQGIILAIDTALHACSVAIIRQELAGYEVLARVSVTLARGQAEKLAPMVMEALKQAGQAIEALDRVVVTIGPGGFTGVRAGLAFARGLTLGTGVSLVGVSTLEALAASYRYKNIEQQAMIVPVIDARRGEVYMAAYDVLGASTDLQEVVVPLALAPKGAKSHLASFVDSHAILIGSGAPLIGLEALVDDNKVSVEDNFVAIEPVALAILGLQKTPQIVPISPLYLRAPDAKPSAKSLFAELGLGE